MMNASTDVEMVDFEKDGKNGMKAMNVIETVEKLRESDHFNSTRRTKIIIIGAAFLVGLCCLVVIQWISSSSSPKGGIVIWKGKQGSSSSSSSSSTTYQDCPKEYVMNQKKENISQIQEWLNTTVTISDGIQYEVLETLHHDQRSFTEGLCFVCGRLFESIGLNGQSALLELDPTTGDTIQKWPMKSTDFGEGLTFVQQQGLLIQLTYKRHIAYQYQVQNLSLPPEQFSFTTTTGEGWGLTYNPQTHELIESDGSQYLHFWHAENMTEIRKIAVHRMNGMPVKKLNELEYYRGRVLANIWFQDVIVVINPETGIVEKEYDFRELWPLAQRRHIGADVLNGISVSDDPDVLFVVGKRWDRMFKIRLLR